MKKNRIILSISLLTVLSLTVLYAGNSEFSGFSRQVLAIKARPTSHTENNKIIILHPMIKDREVEMVHTSKLSWKNNKSTRTFLSFRQIKGKKAKGDRGVGKTVNYFYIPKDLKEFCSNAKISDWKKNNSLTLDKKASRGYSFIATLKGERRKSNLHLDGGGKLKAIGFGFPEEGISHEKTMKDDAITWYFDQVQGKTRLVKIYKITTEKKGGIPIIKIKTERFSGF